jgi:hypothetical protein
VTATGILILVHPAILVFLNFRNKEFTICSTCLQNLREIVVSIIEHYSLKAKYDYWDFSEKRWWRYNLTTEIVEHSSLRAERGQALLALSLSLPPSSLKFNGPRPLSLPSSSLISTMLPSPPCTMYRVCY